MRAWTTWVSNPVRSPRFRASASGSAQKAAFATGVPPDLYAFHHSTRNSTFLYCPPSPTVSGGLRRLSPRLSHPTCRAAYAPFTPSESGQRSPPTSYRGCWHVVSRGFFGRYCPSSSRPKGVYNPKAVIPHAASLRQAFAHCARFLAAASRRSLGRVAVPVWLAILSDQLPVIGLVGPYPTNNLMGQEPPDRHPHPGFPPQALPPGSVCGLSHPFEWVSPTDRQVPPVLLSRPPLRGLAAPPSDLHA